jgi:hypothetical protein
VTDDLWADLVEVLASVEHAAVLLSGYPCAEVDELGWHEIEMKALISSGSRAGVVLDVAPERVWLNPRCVAGASQQSIDYAEQLDGQHP